MSETVTEACARYGIIPVELPGHGSAITQLTIFAYNLEQQLNIPIGNNSFMLSWDPFRHSLIYCVGDKHGTVPIDRWLQYLARPTIAVTLDKVVLQTTMAQKRFCIIYEAEHATTHLVTAEPDQALQEDNSSGKLFNLAMQGQLKYAVYVNVKPSFQPYFGGPAVWLCPDESRRDDIYKMFRGVCLTQGELQTVMTIGQTEPDSLRGPMMAKRYFGGGFV